MLLSIHDCYYHNVSEAMGFSWLKLTLACIIFAKCAISGAGAAALEIVSFSEVLDT